MRRKTYRDDDFVWEVDQTLLADAEEEATLGQVLDARGLPRKGMKKLFEEKLVLVNDQRSNPHTIVHEGDEIRLQMAKEKIDHKPEEMDLNVLYEDDDILILDKPAGLTVNSHNQTSLANGVAYYFDVNKIKRKVRFLNRLDRDTSGCIVIAKSGLAQSYYQQQIEHNVFEKWYRATTEGLIEQDEQTLELPMKKSVDGIHYMVLKPKAAESEGKMTRTAYNVVLRDEQANTTDVDVQLLTGRTHQIRVAFSHIGHPLVGDELYGGKATGEPFKLRAVKVAFTHMRTGERIEVSC